MSVQKSSGKVGRPQIPKTNTKADMQVMLSSPDDNISSSSKMFLPPSPQDGKHESDKTSYGLERWLEQDVHEEPWAYFRASETNATEAEAEKIKEKD